MVHEPSLHNRIIKAPTAEISRVTKIFSTNSFLSAMTASALRSQQLPKTPENFNNERNLELVQIIHFSFDFQKDQYKKNYLEIYLTAKEFEKPPKERFHLLVQ